MKIHNPFFYFEASPEIIRLAVMMYVSFPHSSLDGQTPDQAYLNA
jgi:hypothetical protein